eukprot:4988632-Pleurochrysis_carterae.AAC.1
MAPEASYFWIHRRYDLSTRCLRVGACVRDRRDACACTTWTRARSARRGQRLAFVSKKRSSARAGAITQLDEACAFVQSADCLGRSTPTGGFTHSTQENDGSSKTP